MILPIDKIRYAKTLEDALHHESFGKYRICTRLYKGSGHLGSGANYYPERRDGSTLHPEYAGIGVHAELDCVSKYETRRATLYIAGLSKTGFEISARPCWRCSRLLANTNLHSIVFFDGKDLVKIKPSDLHQLQGVVMISVTSTNQVKRAIQFKSGENLEDVALFLGNKFLGFNHLNHTISFSCYSDRVDSIFNNDWVIETNKGVFIRVSPDHFRDQYSQVQVIKTQ